MTQQRDQRISEAEVQQQIQQLKKQQQASQPTPTSLPTPTQKPAPGAASVLPPAPPPTRSKFGWLRRGFKKKTSRGKFPFDWLNLLGVLAIPFVVLAIGLYATQQITQQQVQSSERQHQTDLQIARDQQQAAILQAYLDNMQDLLLNQHLSKATPYDEVSQVAKERTLTTLRRLDAEHNKIVLRFLQDAKLIGIQDAVIDLSNADLSGIDLSGASLNGIDLSGASLNGTKLSGASLNGTILNGAKLSGADLNGAILSNAFLNGADLSGADLSGANLSGADLRYANLSKAILNGGTLDGAIMKGADLSDAFLKGADLTGAILSDANLSDADLSDASLSDANLSGAILSGVRNLTQQQLDEVYSCKNAIPNRSCQAA